MHIYILIFLFSSIFSQEVFGGYILFTPGGGGGGTTTYLKDIDNSNFNTWSHETGAASMPYLIAGDQPGFENTLLYYPCQVPNPTMANGGVGGRVEIYNWDGDLLWSYTLSNDTYQHHHDIEPLPNGNFLMIAWERAYQSEWSDLGRVSVNNSLNQMWFTAIFEIEPNLVTGGAEIVWEWHIKDHLVQDIGPQYSSTYGAISEHPELMDVNCGNAGSNGQGPGGLPNGDWMHFNAIHYNADLDQIVLSSRHQDEIYIIDHSTTTEEAASHSGGNSGMGGDFLYRWGNPENYGRGNSNDETLSDQHSVNWIPNGYPGEGNLIAFSNFHTNNSSAVVEFSPPLNSNGTYDIDNVNAYGPEDYEWIVTGGFFSQAQGGAFRLPNGNTLITEATAADIFEVDSNGVIVWEYSHTSNNVMIPRAQKYAYDYFDTGILGDLNEDLVVNILDVIICVNMILGSEEVNNNADLNDDGIVNILDIINLVNIILG